VFGVTPVCSRVATTVEGRGVSSDKGVCSSEVGEVTLESEVTEGCFGCSSCKMNAL